MGIVWVREDDESRAFSETADDKGTREYTRKFFVLTSHLYDDGVLVKSAAGIPRKWQAYPNDSLALCVKVEGERVDDQPLLWKVTANYTTDVPPPEYLEHPLLRPYEIEWDFVQYQKVMHEDLDGKDFVNTSKEPFENPPAIEDTQPVLIITRNEADFDPSLAYDYDNSINSDTFRGSPKHCVKLQVKGRRAFEDFTDPSTELITRIFFYIVTYEFHFRFDRNNADAKAGWTVRVLNSGFREYKSSKYIEIKDQFGQPLTKPTLLHKDGSDSVKTTTPEYLEFRGYEERAFAPLGLG
jgi:hypothetical protein